jgi:hypothetical protein
MGPWALCASPHRRYFIYVSKEWMKYFRKAAGEPGMLKKDWGRRKSAFQLMFCGDYGCWYISGILSPRTMLTGIQSNELILPSHHEGLILWNKSAQQCVGVRHQPHQTKPITHLSVSFCYQPCGGPSLPFSWWLMTPTWPSSFVMAEKWRGGKTEPGQDEVYSTQVWALLPQENETPVATT